MWCVLWNFVWMQCIYFSDYPKHKTNWYFKFRYNRWVNFNFNLVRWMSFELKYRSTDTIHGFWDRIILKFWLKVVHTLYLYDKSRFSLRISDPLWLKPVARVLIRPFSNLEHRILFECFVWKIKLVYGTFHAGSS